MKGLKNQERLAAASLEMPACIRDHHQIKKGKEIAPIPTINTVVLILFAFNFCFSLLSLSLLPSHCCVLSMFFSRSAFSVAEHCSHFQRLGCHTPALRASLIFNAHVVRVPSTVIDRFVPEQPCLAGWRLLSERAKRSNKERRRGGKKHINKTQTPTYTFQ